MTNNINDLRNAACIISIGSNTTAAHPIIGFQVKEAVKRGTKLIVVNPREINLVKHADLWLRIHPGADVALIMGMARFILEQGLHDESFINERCRDFDGFKESLAEFPMEWVEEITGIPREQIEAAARMYAGNKPSAILYTLGITEHTHGTDGVIALANLAMLTGNVGKPGSGVNPLRGQNNVQGACDMGALPGTLPGYQSVDNPAVRGKFEAVWNCKLNPKIGLALTEMFWAAHSKQLKSLYLVGEDPVLSEPDMHHTVEALSSLDFLVVQDIFLSETAKLAHVVLPAAGFGADDGTFTNTERRVQRVRKAILPPGEARPDWEIICAVARKMGKPGFEFTRPADVWSEMANLTVIMAGISYERLEKGGIQWPCPSAEHPGTPIMHTMVFTCGEGRFVPVHYRPSAELPDEEYPLILTTERSLFHYHSGTMTRKVAGLNKFRGEELVEINPADAVKFGIAHGERVTVYSRRGEVTARAKVTGVSPAGVISMTFHFSESPTNAVTNSAADPVAKTPELKICAVRVEKAK